HYFDDATNDRIRGELSELLPKQVYEVERQPFLGLMSGLTNYRAPLKTHIRAEPGCESAAPWHPNADLGARRAS
ncbi:hypothetical protein, partial [Stutzerimonas balearica]|uniref:hypothetical protein n=1 Tax=Stutzerimonas balearica TaxID=74829 RepID=UPI00241CA659